MEALNNLIMVLKKKVKWFTLKRANQSGQHREWQYDTSF